ncbi:bacteriohemerythrin [Magnetospirillum sulfuroxidans]|uniref:Hemerythrin family protein n=1 Tax=Magnetospirillum sulfuroxidans TaxID=611300 RepID=A0ABS5IFU8_9PROT|nr:hemerythrin family protein [Magnetospirillum sulfuroxidans]MBR9972638.1 hemerythrin family protein [Magnetospirillum sulfuroxidans]
MSIAWREAMNTGDPTIDADHRHLVDLINAFEAAMSGGHIEHKRVARVLLGLVEYTGEHFKREEDIQLAIRYPYYDSHRRSHRDVLKKLSLIVGEYTKTADGPDRDRMVRDLAGFLKEWLVDHIIQSDLRMRPYIQQMQAQKLLAEKHRREARAAAEKLAAEKALAEKLAADKL